MLSLLGNFFYVIFTQPIFNGLMLLNYVLGDFGLSIIILTVVIRLILYPLFLKQLKSTTAMQHPEMQREIAQVKKDFPKDQRAQLEETQKIYKKYGINPAAGCLPLLIQLPVLYGLFNSLNTVLRNHPTVASINNAIYPFLPHISHLPNANLNWFTFINHNWFINLGNPDPTHILPILAALATFIQLRMSQPLTTSPTTTKNAMAQQMKIMQYIMPVFTLFFAWAFPAGLALYWTTTSVFSMIQQFTVTRWGSLPTLFKFLPARSTGSASTNKNETDKSNTYTGDARKETRLIEAGKSSENSTASADGSVGSELAKYSNGSNGRGAKYKASAKYKHKPRPGNGPRQARPLRSKTSRSS